MALHETTQILRYTQYNLRSHYFGVKDYVQTLAEVHKAIALGFGQTAV